MADIRLQQKQRLQLSAQQVLGSQLLQLPMLQLEQRIYDELQENPLLEFIELPQVRTAEGSADSDGDASSGEMFDSVDRFSKSTLTVSSSDSVQAGDVPESRPSFTFERPSTDRFFQVVQHDSFHEQMLRQLSLHEEIAEADLRIAVELLGNLDADGYFTEDPMVIIDSLRLQGIEVDADDVRRIQRKIQFLDPPGLAVPDLQHRLLVQLMVAEDVLDEEIFLLARRILEEYYDDFLKRRFGHIVRKLGVDNTVVESAIAAIVGLNPHPSTSGEEDEVYLAPDFLVTYENGALVATLNDRSSLSVRVTDTYADYLKNGKGQREEKRYIRQQMQRAQEFTSALETRRHTLITVIESLLQAQYAFFVSGPDHLVPLGMKHIAEETGLDISTISRAVNGKYVQTRFGLFELKFFFSSGLATAEGEEMSSKLIKQQIAAMIAEEDPARPLSDDVLAERLTAQGVTIARRTVAKYREQMQIPVARLRKKIF